MSHIRDVYVTQNQHVDVFLQSAGLVTQILNARRVLAPGKRSRFGDDHEFT